MLKSIKYAREQTDIYSDATLMLSSLMRIQVTPASHMKQSCDVDSDEDFNHVEKRRDSFEVIDESLLSEQDKIVTHMFDINKARFKSMEAE